MGTSAEGAAVVTVTDDGGGIPAEFLDYVFSRFTRAEAARKGAGEQAAAGGLKETSGLGVSIMQSIAEAHGGRITMTSQEGQT